MQDSEWFLSEQDLEALELITSRHLEKSDGGPLGVFEVKVGLHEKIDINMSEWMSDVFDYFTKQYGKEVATNFMKKMVSDSIIAGETIH